MSWSSMLHIKSRYSNRLCLSITEANALAVLVTVFGFSCAAVLGLLCITPREDLVCPCPVTAAALLESNVREELPCSFCHACNRSCSIGFDDRANR